MAAELEFSCMSHSTQTVALLHSLLAEFEQQTKIRVRLIPLRWETARAELNVAAAYRSRFDISEVGSTWVADLAALDALRPFSALDQYWIGDIKDFPPALLSSSRAPENDALWAIPLIAETFVIHYRRDMLAAAGLEPAAAFASHAALAAAVRSLAAAGHEVPIALPLPADRFGALHTLASWVWSRGAAFTADDGRRVLCDQPAVLEAIQEYFDLLHSFSPRALTTLVPGIGAGELFRTGSAPLSLGTLTHRIPPQQIAAQTAANWAAAVLPGARFVGGANLVIWKHSLRDKPALELARYLCSPPVQARLAQSMFAMPARLSVMVQPPFSSDPVLSAMAESIRTGRTYKPFRLWATVEERLMDALAHIHSRITSDPDVALQPLITETIQHVVRRLNLTLGV